MARQLVFRTPDKKVIRIDVTKVRGVRTNNLDATLSVIYLRHGRTVTVIGEYSTVKHRIQSNKKIEREKIQAEFKKKLDNSDELSDEFLKRYLEIKGGL